MGRLDFLEDTDIQFKEKQTEFKGRLGFLSQDVDEKLKRAEDVYARYPQYFPAELVGGDSQQIEEGGELRVKSEELRVEEGKGEDWRRSGQKGWMGEEYLAREGVEPRVSMKSEGKVPIEEMGFQDPTKILGLSDEVLGEKVKSFYQWLGTREDLLSEEVLNGDYNPDDPIESWLVESGTVGIPGQAQPFLRNNLKSLISMLPPVMLVQVLNQIGEEGLLKTTCDFIEGGAHVLTNVTLAVSPFSSYKQRLEAQKGVVEDFAGHLLMTIGGIHGVKAGMKGLTVLEGSRIGEIGGKVKGEMGEILKPEVDIWELGRRRPAELGELETARELAGENILREKRSYAGEGAGIIKETAPEIQELYRRQHELYTLYRDLKRRGEDTFGIEERLDTVSDEIKIWREGAKPKPGELGYKGEFPLEEVKRKKEKGKSEEELRIENEELRIEIEKEKKSKVKEKGYAEETGEAAGKAGEVEGIKGEAERRVRLRDIEEERVEAREEKLRVKSEELRFEEGKGEAADVYMMKAGDLKTDVKRFQNREREFSEQSVERIMEEGWQPHRQAPILIWKSPSTGESFVLAGHSRLEAARRLGVKDVKVEEFKGSEAEAIREAEMSNRISTPETLKEDIKLYHKMKDRGESKAQIKRDFGRRYQEIEDLSGLDPEGKFVTLLGASDLTGFPYLLRNARITGQMRNKYPDKLTNRHEQQIFDYYYMETSDMRRLAKGDLFQQIEEQVMSLDYDPSQPLVIKSFGDVTTGTRARADTRKWEEKLDELRNQQKKSRTVQEYEAIGKEIGEIEAAIKEMVKDQGDIFEGMEAAASVGSYAMIRPSVMEMPEIVELYKRISGGEVPKIKKQLRAARGKAEGVAKGIKIELKADIFKNPEVAKRILSHEIGHVVDYLPDETLKRGNILGRLASLKKHVKKEYDNLYNNKEIRDELKRMSQIWRPFDENLSKKLTSYRYRSSELYADAISVLFNDPDLLQVMCPKFYDAFFKYLERKPEVKRIYEDMQGMMLADAEARYVERHNRIHEMFERGREAEKAAQLKEEGRFCDNVKKGLAKAFWDKNSPLYKKVREAEKRGGKAAPEDNPRYWVEELPYVSAEVSQYLRDVHNAVIKQAKKYDLTLDDMGEMMLLKRAATERSEIANPLGLDVKTSLEQLGFIEGKLGTRKFNALVDFTNRYWEIRQDVIKRLEESGMYDADLMNLLKDNSNYATFDVFKFLEKQYGRGITGHIYQQIGTLSEVSNPFTATVMKDVALFHAAHRNTAVRKTAEMWLKEFPDEIITADKRWNGKYLEPVEPGGSNMGMVVYLEKGNVKAYYVAKDIADTFKRDPYMADNVTNILGWMNRPFKEVFVSKNPGWMIWNIQRDIRGAAKKLPGSKLIGARNSIIENWIKALPHAYKDVFRNESSDIVRVMYKEKEIIPGRYYGRGGESPKTQFDKTLFKYGLSDKTYKDNVLKPFKRITVGALEFIDNIGKMSERTTKIASHMYLERTGKYSPREISHMVRKLGGSPDFYARGTAYNLTNNIWMFSNAGKEGWRSSIEAMRERPGEYWWKTAKYDLLPTTIKWGLRIGLASTAYRLIFKGGDDGEGEAHIRWADWVQKAMNKIPEHDLTNYMCIPVCETEDEKVVYIVMPHDFSDQVVSGVYWKLLNLDIEKTALELGKLVAGGLPYESLSPPISIAWKSLQYATGNNPYDAWSGRPMVSEQEWEAGGADRFKAFANQMWNQHGGSYFYRFPYDDLERIEGKLEKVLNLPVGGGVLKRFLRVSNRGEAERYQKVSDKVRQEKAKESLEKTRMIIEHINNTDYPNVNDAYNLFTKMVEKGYYERNEFSRYFSKYVKTVSYAKNQPLMVVLNRAQSNAERAKILSEFEGREITEQEAALIWMRIKNEILTGD